MATGFRSWLKKNYNYYNAPEGRDPIGKLVGFGSYGVWTGSVIAIYDACMWSHCANATQFLNAYGFWVVPITGMCVAFTAVTYTLTNIRKKDDKFNYFAGALASGSILHAWQKNPRISGWGTALMVFYALLKKQHIQDGMSRSIFLPSGSKSDYRKWLMPWRNLEHRNYTSKPWWPHDKTDYYVNHY